MVGKNHPPITSWLSIVFISITIGTFAVADLNKPFMNVIANQDKYLHFFTFFALLIIVKALFRNITATKLAVYVFLFSLLLELLQEFFTNGNRHFHFTDMLANVLGIGLGVLLVFIIQNKRNKHQAI